MAYVASAPGGWDLGEILLFRHCPVGHRQMMVGADNGRRMKPQVRAQIGDCGRPALACTRKIYTNFEGTSEIERLVISRAISGVRVRWRFRRSEDEERGDRHWEDSEG